MMRNKKNQRFVLVVGILLAIPFFLGAGGQNTGSGSSSGEFNLKGYPIVNEKITVRSALTAGYNMNNPRVLWQKLEELTNIRTDFFVVEMAQLAAFLAAGNFPDFFHNNLAPVYINDYGVLGNRFIDYRTILQYMPNLEKCFSDFPLSRKIMTESNGAIYQVPTFTLEVTSSWSRFYYRKDNMAKYNLSVPRTLDEYYETLKILKQATGNSPMNMDMNYLEMWFFPSFGEHLDAGFDTDSGGQVIFNRTSEQYKRFLAYINKLYREGLLHNEFLTLDSATRLAMAKQGVVTFCGNEIQNTTLDDFPSGEWDIGVPIPFTSQWNNATKVKRYPTESVAGFAISARSRYINQIARLLDIAFARSEVVPGTGIYGDSFAYGPEGLTWRFTNAEKTEFAFMIPPEVNVPPSVYQFDYVIYSNQGLPLALSKAVTSEKSNNRTRQLEFLSKLNPNSRTDFFPVSYIKFTEDEQAIIDNRYTDILSYTNEMRAKFITGVSNIDTEWDNYVRTVNNMGIAEVIKVHQAAYNRWNEK